MDIKNLTYENTDIIQMLQHFLSNCYSILTPKKPNYRERKEIMAKLAPIIEKMQAETENYRNICEKKNYENDAKLNYYLKHRTELFQEYESDKKMKNSIEQKCLGILNNINSLQEEVTLKNKDISNLLQKMDNLKKDLEYWTTVFYATCWIPFANIGTFTKLKSEKDKYSKQISKALEEIRELQTRIAKLNNELADCRQQQRNSQESSSELSKKITALEGEISRYTEMTNSLRATIALCNILLKSCGEISVEISYVDGNIQVVLDILERLDNVRKSIADLEKEGTNNYIKGCICKGDTLMPGQMLKQNEYLLSKNKRFVAVMQEDNNFVVYNSYGPIWDSETAGLEGNGYIHMENNGIVSSIGTDITWNTKREGASKLIMQNDGNLVAYKEDNTPIWASDTYTYVSVPSSCFNNIAVN